MGRQSRGYRWVIATTLTALACSSSTSGPANGGQSAGGSATGGAGGTGASSGGTSGASGGGALWSRDGIAATVCSTLGQDCGSCGGDTICYYFGPNACILNVGSAFRCSIGSCPAANPYCIDDQCMTLEQASCFCTADPGRTAPNCAVSPADHLACTSAGAACGSSQPRCCDGSTCAAFGTDPFTCIELCTTGTDCATGCCVPLSDGTGMICSPAANCP
jgi:hypothetical protein